MLNGWLNWLGAVYANLPDQTKGIIIGASIGLVGTVATLTGTILTVFVTNRGNDSRLARQLKHDREIRDHEREMNLRREIYAGAIETMSLLVHNPIKTFEEFHSNPNAITSMREKIQSLSSVNLVGSGALVKEINLFTQSITKLYDSVGICGAATEAIRGAITFREGTIKELQGSIDAALEVIKKETISGTLGTDRYKKILDATKVDMDKVKDHQKELSTNQTMLDNSESVMRDTITKKASEANKLSVSVLLEMRNELDISTDASTISESLNDLFIGRTEEQSKSIMREVSRALASQNDGADQSDAQVAD